MRDDAVFCCGAAALNDRLDKCLTSRFFGTGELLFSSSARPASAASPNEGNFAPTSLKRATTGASFRMFVLKQTNLCREH
jgi:hypothetical protein